MTTRMKRGLPLVTGCLALAMALGAPNTSRASDHIDGLKTGLDNAADLTDLFAFTSPEDANKLVLILNVHPIASGVSQFSDAVDYMFRIRPIADATALTPSPTGEQSIDCKFSGGTILIDSNQQATCTFNLGDATAPITFATRGSNYSAGGDAQEDDIHVFAGVRSDPWFIDGTKALQYDAFAAVPNTPGVNILQGKNVLSIVIELNKSRFGGSLLGITAQTARNGS